MVIALVMVGIVVLRKPQILPLFHLLFSIAATGLFMLSNTAFSYQNVQYEIRELIFIYAMIYWIFRTLHIWQKLPQSCSCISMSDAA